ncbi:hypothetical protein [Lewinella sp. IMCC34183]|uniref:hypothetical protein n=1 Tax=Lewinella sp. IMCC34183 TaxID=2248762 RepID=UPI000E25941F|nr:hypothetical protein [Lewinella sp. IMCC34183]
MHTFIRKVGVFGAVALLYFTFCFCYNLYSVSYGKDSRVDRSSVLIVGDSHARYGIDPARFSSADNVAQSSEPLAATFWKLEKLLPMVRPQTVIATLAMHNVSGYNDVNFLESPRQSVHFRRLHSILNYRELASNFSVDYKNLSRTLFEEMVLLPSTHHHAYIGTFENKYGTRTLDPGVTIAKHFYDHGQVSHESPTMFSYLDSIINLCAEYDVQLYFVRTPEHENYRSRIPAYFAGVERKLTNKLAQRSVPYLNFSSIDLPESNYYDVDHLNARGATVFTDTLLARIHSI